MNWEPTLHSVFGEISRQLKEKSNLPQETKLKLVFYIEEESIKVRFIGRIENLELVNFDYHADEIVIVIENIGMDRLIKTLDFKNRNLKKTQQLLYEALLTNYEKYGHFKY